MTRLDETSLLGEAAEPVAPPTERALAHGRERLAATIAGGRRRSLAGLLLRVRRLGARVAVPVTAAAMVAVVAAGVNIVFRTEERPPRPVPAQQKVQVDAATVLKGAAGWARRAEKERGPLPAVEGDQYIYIRQLIEETPVGGSPTQTFHPESWRSADGDHDSWIAERHNSWLSPPPDGQWPPPYTELDELPTDPEKLIPAAYPMGDGKLPPLSEVDPQTLDIVYSTLQGLAIVPAMPPGLRAATFEALSTFPGVEVRPRTVDFLGRTGIAVVRRGSFEMVFDARTYAYLGLRTVGPIAGPEPVVQLVAVERWGVADRLKVVPERTYEP